MRRLFLIAIALVTAFALAGCGGGKPDQQAARDGLAELLNSRATTPDPKLAKEVADCMIDKVWDSAHEKTLNAWAEGKDDKDEVSDNVVVFTASKECNEAASQRRADAKKKALGPMPTDSQIKQGLTSALMKQSANPTRAEAAKIADCMLKDLRSKVSETTLRSWAKGSNEVTVDDSSEVRAVGAACGEKVING